MTLKNDIERLFRSKYAVMLSFANRLLRDEDAARDIVHDVFASVLDANLSDVTPAFLMQGVRYACLNHIRKLSARERISRLYAIDLAEIADEGWPDELDMQRIEMLVDTLLPDQCKRVVKMRFNAKMKYKDIAQELGISEVAVYKHLRHAMNVLRQNFYDNER